MTCIYTKSSKLLFQLNDICNMKITNELDKCDLQIQPSQITLGCGSGKLLQAHL